MASATQTDKIDRPVTNPKTTLATLALVVVAAGSARAAMSDFNGDGHPDYVLQNANTHQTAIWYLNNNVFLSRRYGWPIPAGWSLVDVADFDRDGHPDYVLQNANTHQTAIWYLNNNVLTRGAYGPTLPSGWFLGAVGDFNGDGKPDYLLYTNRGSNFPTAIWYMNNNVHVASASGPTLPDGWMLRGVADFNGDGKPDFLLWDIFSNRTAIWYLNNNVFIGGRYGWPIPAGWSVVGVADFDRDGHPDYVLENPNTHQTAIWYLNNNVLTRGAYGPTLPPGWNLVAPFAGGTAPPTHPVVNLRTEGAAGNGTTDDQAVITNAIAKAKSLGLPLYAPGGHTYVHSNYITLDGVSMYGDGDSTVFSASNANAGALRLTGTNPSLKSVKTLYNPTPTTRLSTGVETGVFVDHATGFTVDNVTVGNSPSGGILVFFSHGTATNYATVSNCRVTNTLADAYHVTGTSSYVRLSSNTTTNPGDDMFAVVSYLGDGAQTHDIIYQNNTGSVQKWGRGMSCVGGYNIAFNNNSVSGTNGAGLYIASESSFNSYGSNNVSAVGNTITNACRTATLGHAGILVYGRRGYLITNVLLSGNTVINSGNAGIESRSYVSGIKVTNCTVNTTGVGVTGKVKPGIWDNGSQNMEISNNTVINTGSHSVRAESTATGYCMILTNDFSKINYNTGTAADVINIASSSVLNSLTISNNIYHTDPPGWHVNSFINLSGFAGATVSGNRTIASTSR